MTKINDKKRNFKLSISTHFEKQRTRWILRNVCERDDIIEVGPADCESLVKSCLEENGNISDKNSE